MSTSLKVIPELIEVSKRSVSPYGYRNVLVRAHLLGHGDTWCDISCLTRTMFCRNTSSFRQAIRKRLPSSTRALLKEKMLLIKDYSGSNGEITRVRLLRKEQRLDLVDKAIVKAQLERMAKRNEVTAELFVEAEEIYECAAAN